MQDLPLTEIQSVMNSVVRVHTLAITCRAMSCQNVALKEKTYVKEEYKAHFYE